MKLPKMIGAMARKPIRRQRGGVNTKVVAAEFNDAFDTWAKRHDRTHLGYQRQTFGE